MALKDEWWFSHRNIVAEATLDGGDPITGFEASNVTDPKEDNVWRVVGASMTLKGDLTVQVPAQCVIIRVAPGDDWGDSDEATLSFSNVDSDSNEVGSWTIPLSADPFTGCVAFINASEVSAQYFNLSMPAKDIDYIHIGPAFLPMNFNKNPQVSPKFEGIVERSLFIHLYTGSKSVQSGPQTDQFTGQFEVWDASEFQAWRTFTRSVQQTGPFAFGISQTTQLSESYIAHLTTSVRFQPVDSRWIGQIQLEALR